MAQEKMTERIVTVMITLVVAGVIGVIGSALGGGALIEALGGVQETEPALARRVADLEAKTAGVITKEVVASIVEKKINEPIATMNDRVGALETITIPRGLVVAFDRDDLNADKCPPGWQPFKEARARVILGAGDPSKAPGKYGHDELGRPLTHYVRGQHKGEEKHKLLIPEMPKHNHPLSVVSGSTNDFLGGSTNEYGIAAAYDSRGRQQNSVLKSMGESTAHNNMPPYIALYFCKKE